MLDYRRFVAARYREFVREQREIIAEGAGEEPKITVNEPSWIELPHVDAFSLSSEEDFVSLDNCPVDGSGLNSTALGLDFARSTGKGSFWVGEQQAGAIPSGNCAIQPRPGELRLWSYQAAARGAEAIMYFRWRTAAAGQQMHWCGILDSDGMPRRRFKELKETVAELKEYSSLWEGAVPDARVAILIDYNSAWALESTPLGAEIDYFEQVKILYALLRERGICVDFVGTAPSAGEYDLVIAPAPFVCTSKNTSKLHLYVREGGTLLLTAPAGYKTEAGTALETAPPGLLGPIIGVETVEHEVLRDVGENFIVFEKDKAEYPAGRFCSIMELKGGETMAVYKAGYYSGSPAITRNSVDDGTVVYMGAHSSKEGFGRLIEELLDIADIPRHDIGQAQGVEYVPLIEESGERKLVFVLNHTSETAELDLGGWGGGAEDVLGHRRYDGNVVIDPFDVLLLRI
jgi:beta-galactosidase